MLIGLAGFKGSGKDTAGAYLTERYGFDRRSFAAPMKASYAALYDVDPAVLEVWKNDPGAQVQLVLDGEVIYSHTHRVGLQRYGTEAHRLIPEFGESIWTDLLLHALPEGDVVITDSRFDNECDAVRASGGVLVWIERGEQTTSDTHASENKPTNIDYTITNNGSFEELYTALDMLVATLEGAA